MKRILVLSILCTLVGSCSEVIAPIGSDVSQESSSVAVSAAAKQDTDTPFTLTRGNLQLDWVIARHLELACGGDEIAGGASRGQGNFSHLGWSTIAVSAAWDIGNLIDPADVQFVPVGPAGGPVATVLGVGDYPYDFHFNPFTGECEAVVSATGEVELTAANGDKVFGVITGGETHRLDFVTSGDGVETFAFVEFVGGTGRFENATGSFISHTINRFDALTGNSVVDLVEVLPSGAIVY